MSNRFSIRSWSPYGRASLLLVLIVIAVLPIASFMPSNRSLARVEPGLLSLAAQRPDSSLKVIVQKLAADKSVEQLVTALGGVILDDLYIINGFSATLPGKAIPQLANTAGVRWISLDAPVVSTGTPEVSSAKVQNTYIGAIKASKVWNETAGNYQGQGIGVAIVDSGVNPSQDFYTTMGQNRLVMSVAYNSGWNQSVYDAYGHGNHVAGIVGGNGARSNGAYIGVAPMVNLINVKVSDDTANGIATASNVVNGLQWINDNRTKYNIRVVNLSLNESVAASYHVSPLSAALEILWFNKVVVVVSAGNYGQVGALYPPANDPFVITVGATDDKGTTSISDDTVASFSAYGKTSDGFSKPDLVAPGKNIVSVLGNTNSGLSTAHPGHVVLVNGERRYFRMSGTSMSAPMVAGAAALILQANPNLTPDQVKYRLKATARPFATREMAGAGYLDVYAAVTGTTTESANTNIPASKMLFTGSQPLNWNSANWNSANWNSANWNSANWNSANWNSANWNSDYWGN